MKKVTLKKLILDNWRAQTVTIEFSDKTIIRGTNGAGKSTIFDAFLWLLTGVDSQDRTNFDLYDNTKEFSPENAIPAVVEGVFDVDGVECTFKRSAKQKWTRPRGKSEYVKAKSDEYTFYIDDLAVSANIYKERVEFLFAPTDKLKLMLNVRYYQKLDWKELRKHFSDIAGVISDNALKGDYSSIEHLLIKYGTVDKAKEKLRQEITPLKDSEKSLDAEIKGMKAMLPDINGIEETEALIVEKRKRINEIDKEIVGLGEANKPFIEKRRSEEEAIAQKKAELAKAESDWNEEQSAKIKAIQAQISDIDAKNKEIAESNKLLENQRRSLSTQLEIARQQRQFYSDERDRLKVEKDACVERLFDENQVCESCGQKLPHDRIEELKKSFFDKKEKDRLAIIERGVRARDNRDAQEKIAADIEKTISELPSVKPLLSKNTLLMELDEAEEEIVPFEDSQIYGILTHQIEIMESQLTKIPEIDSVALQEEKATINRELEALQLIAARKTQRLDGEDLIARREKVASEIGVKLARLVGLFDKCVEREREWASIVSDRANKFLTFAHVEMTEFSKSGEINDICTITIGGVDAKGTLNNAHQIIAGIDIANAFQKNADVCLPIFIDDAERIVDENIPACENQMVLAYVDKTCLDLVVG